MPRVGRSFLRGGGTAMAELLVRAVDKTNPTEVWRDVKLTKAFDVICVRPDGWPWSVQERTNPAWRIVALPLISEGLLTPLTDPEPGEKENIFLQIRGRRLRIDKSGVPGPHRTWWNDATRAEPIRTFNVDFAWLQANVIETKAPRTA